MADQTVIIKGARLAFPDLWVATEYQKGDGKPRYSAVFLLPKDDPQIATIKALGLKMFKEEFKDKEGAIFWSGVVDDRKQCALSDGDKKVYDGFEGMIAITAHRKAESGKPLVIDRDAVTPLRREDGKPYAGCYVNAKLSFWVQDNTNGKGFRATLDTVQFVRDGDAFSGAAPASAEGMEPEPEEAETPMV